MSWHGHLSLNYTRDGERTIALDRHEGPLRVLQRLYPEGPGICHHVLVHPPGGIVGGDILEVDATLQADNHLRFELAQGAEMIGWDLLALGLPAAGEHFDAPQGQHGRYTQCVEIPGVWLERGTIKAADHTLLDSPLGWAGHRVMGTMWFAAGHALSGARREALLDQARELITAQTPPGGAALHAGATSPHDQVVVVRALADKVEPLMALMAGIWGCWREAGWAIKPCAPRVWRT